MIDEAIRIIDRWKAGELPPPEEVQIYPTNRCNLACSFCVTATGFYSGQQEVPKKRWLSVARELCDLSVRRVLISGGGEPLLSGTTIPMMRLLKQSEVYGRMITNGTLWDAARIRAAVRMGWDQVMFSIDGPDAVIHDRLRGTDGCFDRALFAIRAFGRLKTELGSSTPQLEVNSVLCRENYRSVGDMVALASREGIAHLNLEPVCINNPRVESMRLREKEREELQERLLPAALELAQEHDLSTNIPGLRDIGKVETAGEMRGFILDALGPRVPGQPFLELACYEPWLWPKIEANGEVWPCSTIPLKENIMEKSFIEIWDGKIFREYRRRIIERDLPESCQNCVVSHLTTNSAIRSRLRQNVTSRDSSRGT